MSQLSSAFAILREFIRTKIGISILVVLVMGVGGYLVFSQGNPTYQFVVVERGSITELVSVTGNTTPISSVSLGFGNSGNIARVYSSVGDIVERGDVLAELNTADLEAQVQQAQSTLTQQLAENQNTTTNVDQVRKEQNTLVKNAYNKLLSEELAAVPSSSYEADPPTITGLYDGPEGTYRVRITRKENSTDYELYTFGLETLDSIVVLDDEPTPLGTRGLFIALPDGQAAYDDTIWNITIPNTKSTSYLANYNAYQAALQARDRAIASAEAQITNFGGVTVAQAQIENAQAAVRSAQARLQNSRITAPIAGIITQFDAKVGEFASPGTALISIISKDMFEVEAQVSETDVGKVALGNKVTMTIDAFLGETFNGSIFYIDPAQTTTEGVVGYKIKIAFDQNDDRMKSGLTVNLDIETRKKDNVLYLPQYAVLQNDEGTFVQILESGVPKNIPITLGLQDQNGNVEIISGVSEGEQVLNIGLKTQ